MLRQENSDLRDHNNDLNSKTLKLEKLCQMERNRAMDFKTDL